MYIPDGSTLDYSKEVIENRYSWGWLGDSIPASSQGWKDSKLKKRVMSVLDSKQSSAIIMQHMGSHDCEICHKLGHKPKGLYMNGSFLITHGDLEFRCPVGVIHYIEDHDYNPGSKVIEALFEGTWATREEEEAEDKRRMDELCEKWRLEDEEKERNMTPRERQMRDLHNEQQADGIKKLAQLRKDKALVR